MGVPIRGIDAKLGKNSDANAAERQEHETQKAIIQNIRARETKPSTPEPEPPTSTDTTIIKSKSNICSN